MPPTPTGRSWCGVSWKILERCWWCWRYSLYRCFSFGTISIRGWIFRPVCNHHWMRSGAISIGISFLFAPLCFLDFSLCAALAFAACRSQQDKDGNPRSTIWMRKVSFISLPMFALCLTFGAFDWLMSLNYHWFSTMFGVYIFAGRGGELDVTARPGHRRITTSRIFEGYRHSRALPHHGKMDAGVHVFWAYIGFGQYMLIWYANMPEETAVFITRNTESWWVLSMLLVVGRFFICFGILLLQSIKKEPRHLCWVAGWILFMQMLDIYIIVLPALHGTGVHLSIWDFLSLIAIGATLGLFICELCLGTALFPVRDPRLIESLHLVN